MLEADSPASALPQVDRRRFPGFRSSGALESDSPSLRLIPKASPSSPACDHLPVLSGSSSFSIAFELHLTLTVRPFTSATSPRLLRPLLTSGRNFPRQTSPGKNDHLHRTYASHLQSGILVPSGFTFLGRLAHPFCLSALRVPRVAALLPASFRPRLTTTPLPSANGSCHHGPYRTFTSQ